MNAQNTGLYLNNPDTKRIYSNWHYCRKCLAVYSHSQNDFNKLKKRECCSNPDYLETISTAIGRVPINTAMLNYF